MHLNVSVGTALHRVVVYCTQLDITPQRLEQITRTDLKTWKNAKRSVHVVFPKEPAMLVTPTSVPLAAVQQEANTLLQDISSATQAIQQAREEESSSATEKKPKKRKRTKPLSELSDRYQKKTVAELITELKARFNDSWDNILMTVMTLNRTAAIKAALQLEGIDTVLNERILDTVKFTAKEMVDLMV